MDTAFTSPPPVGRPTMKDVAFDAGVSLKTVSRVVNDEPVSAEKRRAVRASIDRLGFTPNLGAAMLRRGQTGSIGFVVEDASEPFQASLIKAIEAVAAAHDRLLFVCSYDSVPEREVELVRALTSRRVDGLVIVPSRGDHHYLQSEIAAGVPVVIVDRTTDTIDADTVLADNVGGARTGTRHLVDHGHRRIACVADLPTAFTANERVEGYVAAVRQAGIEVDTSLIFRHDPKDTSAIDASVRYALSRADPATAFLTGNSLITYAVLRSLSSARAHPAIVAFDDFELADVLDPGITVVAQDSASIGRNAADLLFRRIDGGGGAPVEVRLRTRLIERGSGEVAR
jgi:LacI family transcriptional regulator